MNIIVNREKIIAISNAVKQKAGMTESDTLTLAEMPDKISGLETGGSGLADRPKDINFYDYNGQLLYAYSFDEASQLTEFPSPPQHKNLLFQGWNEPDLDYIKRVKIPLDIGATYTTVDNKTHCFILVSNDDQSVMYRGFAIGGTMYINWGDGSDTESCACDNYTDPATEYWVNLSHKFEKAGVYDISIWAEDCEELLVDTKDLSQYSDSSKCDLIEVNFSSQVKRLGTAETSSTTTVSALEYSSMLRRVSIPLSVEKIHNCMREGDNDPWYPVTIVIPSGVKEISYMGSPSCIYRMIYPRGIEMYKGSGQFYLEVSGNNILKAVFPDMEFKAVDGGETTSFPYMTGHSNTDYERIRDAFFIFKNAANGLFRSINMSRLGHIHIGDEDYQAAYTAWKEQKASSSYSSASVDCKRISMENGVEYTPEMAAENGATLTGDEGDKRVALNAVVTTLNSTTEAVDSGVLSCVAVTPSTYEGEITEVVF